MIEFVEQFNKMYEKQAFFQIEKNKGGLRITLGPAVGRTVVAVGVLLNCSFSSSRVACPIDDWAVTLKPIVQEAKVIVRAFRIAGSRNAMNIAGLATATNRDKVREAAPHASGMKRF